MERFFFVVWTNTHLWCPCMGGGAPDEPALMGSIYIVSFFAAMLWATFGRVSK